MRVEIVITDELIAAFRAAAGFTPATLTDEDAARGLQAVAPAIGRQAVISAIGKGADVTAAVGAPDGPWAPGRRKFRDRPERHRYDDGEGGSRAWNRDLIIWQQEENATPARPVEDRPDPSGLDEFHETWEDPSA